MVVCAVSDAVLDGHGISVTREIPKLIEVISYYLSLPETGTPHLFIINKVLLHPKQLDFVADKKLIPYITQR